MENKALNVRNNVSGEIKPDSIKNRLMEINSIQEFVKSLLKPGEDYGTIKYTKNGKEMETKPFLYKSGAEKIAYALGLRILVDIVDKVIDENEIAYTIKCKLVRNDDVVISEGFGVASTSEYKFWKQVNESMKAGMPKDVAMRSISNTILKMAEKRAVVDASLHIFALSGFFSQDEDYVKEEIKNEGGHVEAPKHDTPKQQKPTQAKSEITKSEPISDVDDDGSIQQAIENVITEQIEILMDNGLIDKKFVDYLSTKDILDRLRLLHWKIKEIIKNNPNLAEDQATMLLDMKEDLEYLMGETK
jgi:hypothetical protein